MVHFYITHSNHKVITIPFVPPVITKKKIMEDKYALLNKIFGDSISDEFEPICTMLVEAIRFGVPEYWDEAGMMLLSLGSSHYEKWGNHCFNVANYIRNMGYKKTKKTIPFYSSEDSVKKFKRLIIGVL